MSNDLDSLPNHDSALETLEHELYNPKAQLHNEESSRMKNRREINLPTSWSEENAPVKRQEEGMSFGVKFLIFSAILLLAALLFTGWRVLSLRNVVSSANIDMAAEINPFVSGGEATPLTFTLTNKNTTRLESASVTVLYKQGNGSQDEQERAQEKRDIGSVNPQEFKKQDFTLFFYGGEKESRDIKIKLEYKVAGSNAVFSKIISTSVVLSTPPISVVAEGPDTLSSSQSGTYTFTVKNNSATTSLPTVLQISLPNNFKLESTNPKSLSRGTSWPIKPLAKGESQSVTVTGYFDGKQEETGTFQAKVGSVGETSSMIGIVYSMTQKETTLRASPLTLQIGLSSDSTNGEILKYGDQATLTLSYGNASTQVLEDVVIKLTLDGDAAVYKSIDPKSGYYDSIKKTITWDKASLPDLAVLAPNSKGVVQVFVPIVARGVNSPTLKATLTGTAGLTKADDVVATISKTWGVQGSATLIASTQYKSSPFENTGVIPPQANETTTYTISLKVSAQNTLSGATVSFVLPAYVSWRNVSSNAQAVSYDSRSRTVTWNVGRLEENNASVVDIGVSVKPSQSHVGQSPAITSALILNADEEVSKVHLRTTLSPLTTVIKGETWPKNPSVVVEQQ